ncbi:putative U2 small nuclear ribonucleoprotein A' [Porphyridium purpureum]|uniref:Putative U2 small nuclear ribonucleoprotein A n=1 Tax=Porphyridium purpureum TaxID=35688 RepID=A0A5J4YX22_PORPP|nr:putative U2 small nuclear ribonucleoprotein A' [Porphyridium purpureum]|eukprot:POR4506..scf227_4
MDCFGPLGVQSGVPCAACEVRCAVCEARGRKTDAVDTRGVAMRLTSDVVAASPQFQNCVGLYELDLRGLGLEALDNLGLLQDRFGALDVSDNRIRELLPFPRMVKLEMLLAAKNRISHIRSGLLARLPNLRVLVLTQNLIESLYALTELHHCQRLRTLVLKENPVTAQKYYRPFLIYLLPSLQYLDFVRVTLAERQAAKSLFGGNQQSKQLWNDLKGAMPPEQIAALESIPYGQTSHASNTVIDNELTQAARRAIENATSIEQVNAIEAALLAQDRRAIELALKTHEGKAHAE